MGQRPPLMATETFKSSVAPFVGFMQALLASKDSEEINCCDASPMHIPERIGLTYLTEDPLQPGVRRAWKQGSVSCISWPMGSRPEVEARKWFSLLTLEACLVVTGYSPANRQCFFLYSVLLRGPLRG